MPHPTHQEFGATNINLSAKASIDKRLEELKNEDNVIGIPEATARSFGRVTQRDTSFEPTGSPLDGIGTSLQQLLDTGSRFISGVSAGTREEALGLDTSLRSGLTQASKFAMDNSPFERVENNQSPGQLFESGVVGLVNAGIDFFDTSPLAQELGLTGETKGVLSTDESTGPNASAQRTAEALAKGEQNLADGTNPEAATLKQVIVEATCVQAEGPCSEEQRKEIEEETVGFIERLRTQDRIDVLAAGLGILRSAADRSKPAGAVIADGLFLGLQVATRSREQQALQDVRNFTAQTGRMNAISNRMAVTGRANKAPVTEAHREQATVFINNLSGDDEVTGERLIPFAAQAMANIERYENSNGILPPQLRAELVAEETRRLSFGAGQAVGVDDSFFGLITGTDLVAGDDVDMAGIDQDSISAIVMRSILDKKPGQQ